MIKLAAHTPTATSPGGEEKLNSALNYMRGGGSFASHVNSNILIPEAVF